MTPRLDVLARGERARHGSSGGACFRPRTVVRIRPPRPAPRPIDAGVLDGGAENEAGGAALDALGGSAPDACGAELSASRPPSAAAPGGGAAAAPKAPGRRTQPCTSRLA